MNDAIEAGTPPRIIELAFTRESGRAGNAILAQLFAEGWETLKPVRVLDCGHFHTTLFLPNEKPNPNE
jgi:hypothetical protein